MSLRLAIVPALLSICTAAVPSPSRQVPDTRAAVERASRYVEHYTSALRFVLADEEYVQRSFDGEGVPSGERRMRGELYLAFLPADRVWIAVHDVAEVDGTPVADREDLRALLRQGEVTSVARRVADRNASFNLGAISRNFNEPTLPLLLLREPYRSRTEFRLMRGPTGASFTLTFRERERPTLVRSRRGGAVFSRGTMALDPETGRVEATTLQLAADGIQARLETTYGEDPKLGLWVPQTFTEHYEGAPNGRREAIVCESRYSNYRRFEVVGRIK